MVFDVSSMVQLREARVEDDNWTGLTSPAERRKRQNRLHQRAWRRKKAAERAVGGQHQSSKTIEHKSHKQDIHGRMKPSRSDLAQEIMNLLTVNPRVPSHIYTRLKPFTYWEEFHGQLNALNTVYGIPDRPCYNLNQRQDLVHAHGARDKQPTPKRQAIPPMIPYLDIHDPAGTTIPNFSFPISADHRLLVLIQYNVLRAFITNMSILSVLDRMPLECGAALNIKDLPPAPETIPPNLDSTPVQQRIAHDFWIDIIPWSGMRDNLILNHGSYDEEDLCVDIAGGLYEGFDEVEARGLIVWGKPWSETGWEVTEGFLKKWSFLLKGCHTLIESTNRWREFRGEEKLTIDV
ncbi:uncharacterized protein F4812DRAFT_172071 [Daldinia caldariorum]|uniref:uncharacterized protein n=1 Tax=Daldinia caldariorum TaxID=326644 RepID=UPI0020077CB5|nr:uncharacterized protein F4812DRAFT_172071 [Daldinia caldariorum]KAI1471274.1 hypothetical protein F4812DRAFT_172071 [Daldinia caldariorum]